MPRGNFKLEQLSIPFVVLGMGDEYFGIGRPSPDATGIERFYPGEIQVAAIFEDCLYRLKENYALDTVIERVVEDSGRIIFHSLEINTLLASFYGAEQGIAYSLFRPYHSEEDPPETNDERASFLLGAHLRYGRDNSIRLANAAHKAEVIMRLLRDLGCPNIIWKQRLNSLPNSHVIEFEPSPGLAVVLGQGYSYELMRPRNES